MRTVPPAFSRYALVLLVTLAGVGCPPFSGFKILSPVHGEVVTTASFDVTVKINPANLDAGSLVVKLNGQALTMSGGPEIFTSTVNPGSPLLDDNTLTASADKLVGGASAGLITEFQYLPPKARARLITDPADLISGPLAHGQVGDWLIENDQARYIIQDAPRRDLYSVGQFGGNLIDAELVVGGVRQGNDSFFEFQPLLNIETVLHAETAEVLNDGQDGTPAVIRSCGPDDLIDFINASSQTAELGVTLPPGTDDTDQNIYACNTFSLAPGDFHVRVETNVTNLEPLGGAIYENYVGDYVNGMGQLESWTSSDPAASGTNHGVAELLFTAGYRALSFFGFRAASGVDYSYVPLPVVPAPTPFSLASSFSTSGVSVSLSSTSIPFVLSGFNYPNMVLAPGQTKSFTRLFAVGDGTPGNAVGLEAAAKMRTSGTIEGCVTVDGVSAGAGARVAVGPLDAGVITDLRGLYVTDTAGCYAGEIPVGSYGLAASLEGVPYQGGGPVPVANPVSVTDGGTTIQDVDLPATGRVQVNVTDENSLAVPARVTIVGVDPSPEPELAFSVAFLNDVYGLFRDVTKDRLQYGVVWMEYVDQTGVAEFNLEPGTYQIYVSRGPEYSLYQAPITVGSAPLGTVTNTENAQIHQVVDTAGFISGDYHVHLLASPDSRIGVDERILGYAGEGVDDLIATDHDAITKLGPRISALGLGDFLHSTIGEEITTFDYGHFNSYPQAQDTSVPSNGSTDFGGAAAPGMDFPSLGSYSLTPAQIYAEAQGKLKSDGVTVQNAGLNTVVHVNHIDSHFRPLHINTALEPPVSVLDPLAFDVNGTPEPNNPLALRLDPSVTNFFHHFDGLELWNGASVDAQDSFLNNRIGVWLNHLNQGLPITAIADTDTHTFFNLESAGARTWTPTSTGSQAPNAILDNDIGTAIVDGKAVGGQGVYVQTKIVEPDTAAQADLTWAGSTLVTTLDGTVDLVVDVQAPTWADYDTMEIYINASTNVAELNGGVPVLFGAIPTQKLTRDATDTATTFVVNTVAAAGDQRLETTKTIPLALAGDAWVVVIVKGTVGNSAHMFPVFAYDLDSTENPDLATMTDNTVGEDGVRALGYTNALYVDLDADGWTPPGVSCVDCP